MMIHEEIMQRINAIEIIVQEMFSPVRNHFTR